VRITLTDIGLTKVERKALQRRVLLALTRFAPELAAIEVSLSEAPNPLGGVDRRCRLRVRLQRGGEVRGGAIDGAFGPAVARAAAQVAQRLDVHLAGGPVRRESRLPASAGEPRKPTRRRRAR